MGRQIVEFCTVMWDLTSIAAISGYQVEARTVFGSHVFVYF